MHEVSEDANDEEDDVWDGGKIIFIVMSLFFPCHSTCRQWHGEATI